MSAQKHSTAPSHCANCDQPIDNQYCPACGQKTHIEIPSLWEFIHEYLHHYVSLEGALTRSLLKLLFLPGSLTEEFLKGRRQRYVKPFQLYLSISFIFFVLLGLLQGPIVTLDSPGKRAGEHVATQASTMPPAKASDADRDWLVADADRGAVQITQTGNAQADRWLQRWSEHLGHTLKAFREQPEQANAELMHSLLGHAPYALFCLMPLFAILLLLTYIGRHRVYGMHLVFTLHLHAWLFLVLCLGFVWPAGCGLLFFFGTPVYLWLGLRRVYGGGGFSTAMRTLLLLFCYSCLALIGMLLLLLLSL
ncbi:DUF3667 domain-containing protein [Chromobacterium sp. IIBBL 290-4]|uniref:DUF3667 domain-containing protein n=1 Tax=Chromobacterium sp. IIBBL 290-4 TaxID=2953890 RepID=UPI0020B86912|nr:DUF3667 domain-containing protein [Chromobacterium sp. IIBBL 290-4]UTH72336.1 DUF3667 domain-containing protein [Chromobacterium sp. IIBBL 290-4]